MGSEDDIRTLFVSGLPNDVKEREVFSAFRLFKGFESATLKVSGRQPVAFVAFVDKESAETAKDAMQGVQFDPDMSLTLRIEFAKNNMRKRARNEDGYGGPEKRSRGSYNPEPANGMQGNTVPGFYTDMGPPTLGYPSVPPPYMQDPLGISPVMIPGAAPPYGGPPVPPPGGPGRGAPPCSTLFVANLGPNVTEQELRDLFARSLGFNRLKIHTQSGQPVAFVQFQDVHCSTAALHQLNGSVLRSSDRNNGIRIEFARNPMGTPSSKHAPGYPGGKE